MSASLVELGKRLAEYRSKCNLSDYGIHPNGVRRTPGLRREELAEMTGLSTDLISKLERGKYPSVSARLLNELSVFYRLDAAKRIDLFHLANIEERTISPYLEVSIPDSLQDFVDHMSEYPTFVINRRWDVVGWNEALCVAFGDMEQLQGNQRNILWIMFGLPGTRTLVVDWERHARRVLGQFRLDYDHSCGDPRFIALVNELAQVSPDFAALWAGPLEIQFKEVVYKQLSHATLGRLDFRQMAFRFEDNPNLLVGVHYPLNERTARAIRSHLTVGEATPEIYERQLDVSTN